MKKTVFALLVAASASVSGELIAINEASANIPKIPGEITSIMKKAEPFEKAYNNLLKSCDITMGAKKAWFKNPAIKKVISRFNQLEKGCQGAIVSSCIYKATEKDIKNPEKIAKNPLPYATRAAGCINNTAKDIANEKRALKRQAEQLALQAAREAENAAKEAAKKAEEEAKRQAAAAERKAKEAANKVKNEGKKAGKKIKKLFRWVDIDCIPQMYA